MEKYRSVEFKLDNMKVISVNAVVLIVNLHVYAFKINHTNMFSVLDLT